MTESNSLMEKNRTRLLIHEYEQMNETQRHQLALSLGDEALMMAQLAERAKKRDYSHVARDRFRDAAQLWQRAAGIEKRHGYDEAAERFHDLAEDATDRAEEAELRDLRRVCEWQGIVPVLHEGWYRSSTGYDPKTGEGVPDMGVESKLCREARGELEAYRTLARKIENGTLI